MPISLTDDDTFSTKPSLTMSIDKAPDLRDQTIEPAGAKLHLALGPDSPGLQETTTSVQTGMTENYKKLIADRDRLNKLKARNEVLQNIFQADPSMVTPEVVGLVQGLSNQEVESPDLSDIIERKYSQVYTNTATSALENDVLQDSMGDNPDVAHELIDRSERAVYKNQIAQTALSVLAKENDDRTLLQKGWDFAERMVPFVEWYQKQNAVGTKNYVTSVLPGNNLEDQYSYLAGLSPEEFKVEFNQALEELKSRNLYVAQSWVEGFLSYGSDDAVLDNVIGLTDVASVVPAKALGTALKGVVKGSMKSPLKVSEVAAQVGRYSDSAKAKVVEDISKGDFLGQNIRHIEDLEASIPSITSPNRLMVGGIDLPQEAINRLKDNLVTRSERAREILLQPNLLDRVTPEEVTSLIDSAMVDFEKNYPNINKNVIGVTPLNADVGNTYRAKIQIGRRDGTLFESEKQAENYVKRYIKPVTSDFQIEQIGSGFQVTITKNLDESRLLTDTKLATEQRSPETLANSTIGWLRSPDYLVSKQQTEARGVVVHSSEWLAQAMGNITEPISRLGKQEYSELEDLMIVNRTNQEYYETFPDFQKAFFDRFKKNPTENQFDAYFAYVQANDLDLVIRDLDWYKQKARLGIEDITINTTEGPKSFEGKVVGHLPLQGDFRIVEVIDGKAGKVKSSRFLSESERRAINTKIEQGWKLVQVADQNLEIAKGKRTGFVLTKELKRDRIGVKNVDRKAGGHKVHEYSYYVKQPKLSSPLKNEARYYSGDRTLFNARSQAEANEIADLFEQARKMVKENDPGAMKFIRDNLPISTRQWAAKVASGEIDLDAPFVGTQKGHRTLDTKAIDNIIDTQNSEFNLTSRLTGRYGGTRDVTDIDIIRSEGNSVFSVEPAPYLSPIDTLRQSTSNAISQRVMNDYTILTTQNFIREFGDILDATREELLTSGQAFLVNPKFKPNADPRRVATAKNVSRSFNGLVNYGTDFDRTLTSYKETLLKGISDRLGPKGAEWVDERMIPAVKSGPTFMRSIAFHSKLGLFNLQQLFVQANQMVNVVSLAGRDGLIGGVSYPLFRSALFTNSPEVIKSLAKVAQKTGLMDARDFEESLDLFKKSGFGTVGHDVAYLDDLKGPDIRRSTVGGAWKSFLDWGTVPFQEGEKVARISSWQAAYLEHRSKIGYRPMDRRDAAVILQRAKDLSGNMTRDSNAAWQKGYGSVFTQFFGYQARIMEQMLGKKLTGAERLRLFAGFSAMYGLPVAMGSVAGVVPVRDIVIQTMSDMGIEYDGTLMEPFVDGFASQAISFITGQDTNVAARYGPGGLPTFYDLLRGDKEIQEIFMGASGSIAMSTIRDSIPILRGMASEWMDYKGGIYNLTPEDMLSPFRNISTVNNAVQLWNVYNLGVWASKSGTDLTKMDLPEGILAALTGLQPESIETSFVKYRSVKGHKEYIKEQQKEISRFIKRYMKMEDGPEREKLVRQAKAMMELAGMNLREKNQTWRMGASTEMLNDVFFEQYEKLMERKGN